MSYAEYQGTRQEREKNKKAAEVLATEHRQRQDTVARLEREKVALVRVELCGGAGWTVVVGTACCWCCWYCLLLVLLVVGTAGAD